MKSLGLHEVNYWRKHLEMMRKAQSLALQMLCHPDVTPEMLWQVHESMTRLMKEHREIAPKVRERWPRYGTFADL